MKKQNTIQLAINSLFASLSVILSIIGHYISFPVFGFKLEFSDIPVFTSSLLFGPSTGYLILFISSFIRSLFFSVAGIPGFIMKMTSIIPVFFLGIYYRKKRWLILLCTLSLIISIVVKIPISYIFWTKFSSMSPEQIKKLLFPIIIPYNFIKLLVNLSISIILFRKIRKFFWGHYQNQS